MSPYLISVIVVFAVIFCALIIYLMINDYEPEIILTVLASMIIALAWPLALFALVLYVISFYVAKYVMRRRGRL